MWRKYNSVAVLQCTPVTGRPARANHGAATGASVAALTVIQGTSAKPRPPRSMDLRPVLRRDRQRHGPGTMRCTDGDYGDADVSLCNL
jgi:hypothetical protein